MLFPRDFSGKYGIFMKRCVKAKISACLAFSHVAASPSACTQGKWSMIQYLWVVWYSQSCSNLYQPVISDILVFRFLSKRIYTMCMNTTYFICVLYNTARLLLLFLFSVFLQPSWPICRVVSLCIHLPLWFSRFSYFPVLGPQIQLKGGIYTSKKLEKRRNPMW